MGSCMLALEDTLVPDPVSGESMSTEERRARARSLIDAAMVRFGKAFKTRAERTSPYGG